LDQDTKTWFFRQNIFFWSTTEVLNSDKSCLNGYEYTGK
jgi:hypothetical protein